MIGACPFVPLIHRPRIATRKPRLNSHLLNIEQLETTLMSCTRRPVVGQRWVHESDTRATPIDSHPSLPSSYRHGNVGVARWPAGQRACVRGIAAIQVPSPAQPRTGMTAYCRVLQLIVSFVITSAQRHVKEWKEGEEKRGTPWGASKPTRARRRSQPLPASPSLTRAALLVLDGQTSE